MTHLIHFLLLITASAMPVPISQAQATHDVVRIEFNAGTRTFREQIVVTPDSLSVIKEDFRVDQRPRSIQRTTAPKEWNALLNSLRDVRLSEVETLESPSMKRTYDGAAHGSIIITSKDGKTVTHGFDDEEPHQKLVPLMEQLRKLRKK